MARSRLVEILAARRAFPLSLLREAPDGNVADDDTVLARHAS
jgi:hypothetical protein